MTSILDQHATDRQTRHACGGTILTGGSDDQAHRYCDRCGAYTYDLAAPVPSGTDEAANRAAWDAGDAQSPIDVKVDASRILAANGVTLTDGADGVPVSRESLPREQARACVTALRAIGVEASDAPDADDHTQAWLYVTTDAE